jgi:hypothetical protein
MMFFWNNDRIELIPCVTWIFDFPYPRQQIATISLSDRILIRNQLRRLAPQRPGRSIHDGATGGK